MILLLDAHALLWFITGDNRLSKVVQALIEEPNNNSLVRAATLWEIAIKTSLGRLTLTLPFDQLINEQLQRNGFQVLGIEARHPNILIDLPFHHRDPLIGCSSRRRLPKTLRSLALILLLTRTKQSDSGE